MSLINVTALFTAETADKILAKGLTIAKSLGLPVTSWRTGDPTRSLYKYLAVKLASVDSTVANLSRSAFLSALVEAAKSGDDAAKEWLKIVALEVYGVEAQEATFAEGTITLENTGGGFYPVEAGDLTFKSTITGKTYHNTSGPRDEDGNPVDAITAGSTVVFDFTADEAGSDSTVAADEIDSMVTTLLGVEIVSNTAAVADDEQSPESIEEQCKDSLGALSPDGPADVYRYVARNSDLTGITTITRAFTVDNEDGTVTVYIAGASGSVPGGDVTAVQDAFDQWATPNCVTATAVSATGVTIDVDATVAYSGTLNHTELVAAITAAISSALAEIDIGGDPLTTGDNGVALDMIVAAIRSIDGVTSVAMTDPTANTLLDPNEVPILGTVAITEA